MSITLEEFIFENSVGDAKELLDSIINYLESFADHDFENTDALKIALSINYHFSDNEAFLPGHIKWIFDASKRYLK